MRRRRGARPAWPAVLVVVLCLAAGSVRVWAADEMAGVDYMTLLGPDGGVICQTGFALDVGDEYVDSDNNVWRVAEVVGKTAIASYVRELDLSNAVSDFQITFAASPLSQGAGRPRVGVYHTHSDESYVPTDGSESDPAGRGGVYQVGDTLTNGLERAGISVVHSLANHLPHDAGAYERSRRTAMEVLRGSAAIFDVHRDAAPAEAYLRRVGGQDVTQVMIVVGRTNPQAEANMAFAKAIKAASDSQQPGLIRGILTTGGRFNQDLSPRALLFEVGAHTNRREDAEEAVRRLAGVIPQVLGAGGGGVAGSGALRALGVIVLLVVVGGGAWLYVATGGNWRAAWQKLRSLGEEFASYFGRRRPHR